MKENNQIKDQFTLITEDPKTGRKKTIVGIFHKDKKEFHLGTSLVGKNDTYNKKIGKAIAEGRAKVKPIVFKVADVNVTSNDLFKIYSMLV